MPTWLSGRAPRAARRLANLDKKALRERAEVKGGLRKTSNFVVE